MKNDFFPESRNPPLSKYLDLLGEERGILYGSRGRYARIFRLSGAPVFFKSEPDLAQIYRGIGSLLHVLPEGMGLQFRVETRIRKPDGTEENPFFRFGRRSDAPEFSGDSPETFYHQSKKKDFEGRVFRERALYMAVVSYPDEDLSKIRPSLFPIRSIIKGNRGPLEKQHRHRIESLDSVCRTVDALLPGCGILGTLLEGTLLWNYLFDLLNPGSDGDIPEHEPDNPYGYTLGERVGQTGFIENPSGLMARTPAGHAMHGKMFALRLLPSSIDRDTIAPILHDFAFSHDIVLNLWKPEAEKCSRAVQTHATLNRFLTLLLPGKSYRLENDISKQDAFLMRSHQGPEEERVPYLLNLAVRIWGESESDLLEKGKELTRGFSEAMGASVGHELFRQWPLFLSFLPLQGDANDRWEVLLSKDIAPILPIWDKTPDPATPWFISKNHLDEPVAIDLWDSRLPNHNGLVLGRSGSGKSFGVKMLLGQFLSREKAHHAIVVENGGDFERFCRFFESPYMKVDLSGVHSLNPFPTREQLCISDGPPLQYDPDLVGFLTGVMETFIAPSVKVEEIHRKILSSCLISVYDRLPDHASRPMLSHLVQELFRYRGRDTEDETTSYAIGKILDSWATGIYGALFNHPKGFDFDSRLMAFDLGGLDHHEHLKGILFAFIGSLSLYRLKEGAGRRKLFLVFDEAHRILRYLQGTEFLSHLYRTVRKFGGAVIAISQSPSDFTDQNLAAGILNNTAWKWVFPLQSGVPDLETLGFHERERDLVETLEFEKGVYSEVLSRIGEDTTILRLEPSPVEYWISAKSPEEDARFAEALETGGSFMEALRLLTRERS